MGYYTKSYRSTEWIKIHFYDERNTPKVKHWISKKIYCKVFSCTSLVKILDVAKFHLTLLQEPDPVHSPSVVVKEKWQNVETLVVLLTVCMSMRGIGNVKREALKEFGNGNGNCTILNGKKWDLKWPVTETLRSKKTFTIRLRKLSHLSYWFCLSIEKEVRQIVCYNVVRKKWDLNPPTPHSPLLFQEPQ